VKSVSDALLGDQVEWCTGDHGDGGPHPHHSADARTRQHPPDAAQLERDRRRTQEWTGSAPEERRPTASP